MHIHIGNKRIISDNLVVGIFNSETLDMSPLNENYTDEIKDDTKSIIVDIYDEVILSNISSYTIIKRNSINNNDYFWRRINE